MTELEKLLNEVCTLNVIKAVFSTPYDKNSKLQKASLRLFDNKYQLEVFRNNQAFHENFENDELCNKITSLLNESFRQAEIFTQNYIYGFKISSKGKVLHNKRKNTENNDVVKTHNREKKHIIDLENAPEVFYDIGIVDKNGKIINSKYDKYKQICRFVEFIDDVVKNDPRDAYNIVDFGCGKSYLTFVCYHYMTKIMNKKVNIVGLDLKQKVIEDCNNLCKKYGYSNLSFLCMDIKDYRPTVRPDMVIALHACDIATDYAIYNAYKWQSDYIFSVPCCQHELNKKFKSTNFSALANFGLIKERLSSLITDTLRAKTLELCGYSVDVLEFIDFEHSPKNILIRAKRTTKINDVKRNAISLQMESLISEFNAELELKRKVDCYNKSFDSKDKNFRIVVGKASMLLKDAFYVRNEVFLKEQNYSNGASRDKFDETSWFANVYFDSKVVATSRLAFCDDGKFLLGKIAVLKDFRSYGVGKHMLCVLINIAKEEKAENVFVNAQENAKEFYLKSGFDFAGNSFEDQDKILYPMLKKI